MGKVRTIIILGVVGLALGTSVSAGTWEDNGLPICTESGDQQDLQILADGEGGFFIVWQDMRNGDWDIYAQRRNLRGELLWGEEDLAIALRANNQTNPRAVSDGSGGFWVVWTDERTSSDIYGQHVFADGTFQWQDNGTQICSAQADQFDARIVANGFGGAVVVWTDTRSLDGDIFAQHIDASGTLIWASYGILISNEGHHQDHPELALLPGTDWDDTRITVVWEDSRNGNVDIYAQRVTLDGVVQWGIAGVPVYTDSDDQELPRVVAGLSSSSFIAWEDNNSTIYYNNSIKLFHLDRYGTSSHYYSTNGHEPFLEPDSFGGVLMGYNAHVFADPDSDPRLRRYNPDGSSEFHMTLGYNWYWEPLDAGIRVVGDGTGGGIACFFSHYYSDVVRIRATRISPDGDRDVWGIYVTVCGIPAEHRWPEIIMLDEDNVLVAWCDARDEANTGKNIFTQRLAYADGAWGYLPPHIRGVSDLPGDSGGAVAIHLEASDKDIAEPVADPITGYNVWRQIDEASANFLEFERVLEQMSNPTKAAGQLIDEKTAERLGFPEGSWISLGFHAAVQQREYTLLAATVSDSSAAEIPWETFVVTAHTPLPTVFYISEPASGYSVDNSEPDNLSDAPQLAKTMLFQNRPNPFNPSTTIAFEVVRDCKVNLRIFDVTGRLVRKLISGETMTAGHHEQVWSGRDDRGRPMPSGSYYYCLDAGGVRETRRMVLVK